MIKQDAHFKANPKVNPLEETSQQRRLRKKALVLGEEHKEEHNPKRAQPPVLASLAQSLREGHPILQVKGGKRIGKGRA